MNKTSFLKWVVAALVLLNLGTIAFFSTKHRPPRHEGPRKIIAERLSFDAAQVSDYKNLIEKHQININQKEEQISTAKKDLYVLLQGADFSKRDSLIQRIGEIQKEIEQVHFSHFQEIKSLCKDSQLADFEKLASELALFFGQNDMNERQEAPRGK